MNQSTRVSIQTADFDLSSEVAQLRAQNAGVGAVGWLYIVASTHR